MADIVLVQAHKRGAVDALGKLRMVQQTRLPQTSTRQATQRQRAAPANGDRR